jgi:Tol biopolymer transport system component
MATRRNRFGVGPWLRWSRRDTACDFALKRLPAPASRRLRLESLERRDMLAVELVSANLFGGSGNSSSVNQQLSDNGRYVVFQSNATDLVAGDSNQPTITDVFRRDLLTGQTVLVSVATTAAGANNSSLNPVISGDGRYVAFESFATNLVVTQDFNSSGSDLFLRDVVSGATTLISRSAVFNGTANLPSIRPSISNDGRFVAYESQASDLVTTGLDNNGNFSDIYVWDRLTQQNRLISTAAGQATSANRNSTNPQISDDGQWVAFVSDASNVVTNDVNAQVLDVFVRSTGGGATELVSVSVNGISGNNVSTSPSISDDGRYIAFTSIANNLVPANVDTNSLQDVFLRDRSLASTALVSVATTGRSGNSVSEAPVVSNNGRVAFVSAATNLVANDTNAFQDVFWRDTIANVTVMVSLGLGGSAANGNSSSPVINDDGRYVAFASNASNLVANDTNFGITDIFRRDLATGAITLVSSNAAGTGAGNSNSRDPVINGNGQAIAFESNASDLVVNDTNQFVPDIFALVSSNEVLVTGADAGGGPHVRVYDARNLTEEYGFFAYDPRFTGGVRVATADVNFDGVPDIITAAGPGGGPHVRVFNGAAPAQQLPGAIGSFFAYSPMFTGGVYVAAADIDRDGRADIITGADTGGGPHVRVFSGATGAVLREFFAFAPNFTGGVRVGAADIDGDGTRDILTATGPGTASLVRVFSGATGAVVRELSPYGAFGAGVYISAGDVNLDGRADIITGAGPGGGPHVRSFSGVTGLEIFGFFAYDASFRAGVRVASIDINGDGRAEILVGSGFGPQSNVRVFNPLNGALLSQTTPYPGFGGGVFVAGSVPGASSGSPIVASQTATTSQSAWLTAVRSGEISRLIELAFANQQSLDEAAIDSLSQQIASDPTNTELIDAALAGL